MLVCQELSLVLWYGMVLLEHVIKWFFCDTSTTKKIKLLESTVKMLTLDRVPIT